jgi:hypothetical protein
MTGTLATQPEQDLNDPITRSTTRTRAGHFAGREMPRRACCWQASPQKHCSRYNLALEGLPALEHDTFGVDQIVARHTQECHHQHHD